DRDARQKIGRLCDGDERTARLTLDHRAMAVLYHQICIRISSWYDSNSLLRTSTMSWNETLASSIAIIVWCRGTFSPLIKPVTASLAADCLAEISLTSLPNEL